MAVDYRLYLVTDSTQAILGQKNLVQVVEAALKGGVTVVQYRDKHSDTADLIRTAKRLHAVTERFRVPLLINDRVDVALAVGAEGVHLGQDDMDIHTAKGILGAGAIIGVTASSVEEALEAAGAGASYLGIGTVYATPTKKDSKSIIGPEGVQEILLRLSESYPAIPTVAIGGIKTVNIESVVGKAATPRKSLNGLAVVSAIMASEEPTQSAKQLRKELDWAQKANLLQPPISPESSALITQIPPLIRCLRQAKPLCHNMTNLVVQNFAANVAICIGCSPIMSNNGAEASDLAALGGALVINMGTVTAEPLRNYKQALEAYNAADGPVLLDPVGAGATAARKEALDTMLNAGKFSIIKGNESEIKAVLRESGAQQKGVDSGASNLSIAQRAQLVQRLAVREKTLILMTGETDLLSDGRRTLKISNGHHYLGSITGSGCTLGTTIAAFMVVHKEVKLLAVLAGILLFEIAAEVAAEQSHVHGPGTFVPAFLDALYDLSSKDEKGIREWLGRAKVEYI